MSRSVLLVAAVLLLLAFVADGARHSRHSPAERVSWYNRQSVPAGWVRQQAADAMETVRFSLIVTGQNADELEARFWQLTDPAHLDFGEWMTNAEIEAMVAPSASDLQLLYSTLASHGIAAEAVVSHGDSFSVTSSVAAASSLFQTSFYRFQHRVSGYVTVRQWGEYSVPAVIAPQVELILGVHTFPTIEQRMQMAAQRRAKAEKLRSAPPQRPAWVPQAVANLYGVPFPIAPLSTPEVNAGVIEWVQEVFWASDLANFSVNTGIPLSPVDAHRIVGNNTEVPFPGVEAELDIQWIEGINPGFTPWFWIVSDPEQWIYSFTVEFLTATEYPAIISMSYGLPETMQCEYFTPSDCNGVDYKQYIRLTDKQWMKIGLIGVSGLVCSQDRGVYLGVGSPADVPPFQPEYPGTSLYLTSVGATEYAQPEFKLPNPPPACNSTEWQCISGGSNEQAVSYAISEYLSGGGFSNVSLAPAYQAQAIAGYFSSGVSLPNATVYNAAGRGFPDISAIGYNGYIIDGGEAGLVSGTSMSTPIVAAIVALAAADYARITNSTLGFLNPLLYAAVAGGEDVVTDITIGDNCETAGCNTREGQQDGFLCADGWDPVTGLGSPLYQGMKKYVEKLAHQVVARRAAKAARAA